MSGTFLDAGIDQSVLVDLGVQWRKNLAEMGTVTDFKDNRVIEESEIPSTSAGPSMNDIAKGDVVYILPPAQTVGVPVLIQPVSEDGPSVTVTVPVAALHGGILRQIISVPGMFEISGEQDFTTVVQARVNEELRKRGLRIIKGRVPKKSGGIGHRGRGGRGVARGRGRGRGRGRSSKFATSSTSDEDESDVDDEEEIERKPAGRGGRGGARGRGRGRGRSRGRPSKIDTRESSDKEDDDMDDDQGIKLQPGRGGRGTARGRGRGRGRGQGRPSKIETRDASDNEDTSDKEENDIDDKQEIEPQIGRGRGESSKIATPDTSDEDESDVDDEEEIEHKPGRGGEGSARGRGRGRGRKRPLEKEQFPTDLLAYLDEVRRNMYATGAADWLIRQIEETIREETASLAMSSLGQGGPSQIETRDTSDNKDMSDKEENDTDDKQEIEPQIGHGRGGSSKIAARDTSDKEENDMDDEQEIMRQTGRGGKGAARGRGRGRGRSGKIAARATSDKDESDVDEQHEIKFEPRRGGRGAGRWRGRGRGRGRKRPLEGEQIPQLDGGLDSKLDAEDMGCVDEEEEELNKAAIEYLAEQREKMYTQDNLIICQYAQIIRRGSSWKFIVKDGIMKINGKDYVFGFGKGEAPEVKPVGWVPPIPKATALDSLPVAEAVPTVSSAMLPANFELPPGFSSVTFQI
ncbi:ABC transporter F family member 4-like [Folsomia candida]|uniref:ABC transporter F family member 4-like n=1 Tax=Folsomia candida TaxID=158441 RepID=UPI000B8EFF58|nr:ABC transporter F family member 4-like [Folsomia candida]XP_021961228.1 ABC transporter F family member 4-like [Folsomia candida]